MSPHPFFTMQLAEEHRSALTAAARWHRVFARDRVRITDIPAPGTPAFADWASTLGHAVADRGIDRVELQVGDASRVARRLGVATAATAVLADRGQPDVARQRALGRVLAALAVWEPPAEVASDVA